jgi:hypothetical protein
MMAFFQPVKVNDKPSKSLQNQTKRMFDFIDKDFYPLLLGYAKDVFRD